MTPRPYQSDAIDAIFAHWSTGSKDHGLVVAPTGSGKSFILAMLVRRVQEIAPGTRVLMLTHVRELIAQNESELLRYYPECPVGVFSAGMGRKELEAPILFAGIQSLAKHVHKLDPAPEIVIIDEAHLIPERENTRYNDALKLLEKMNPKVKILGLTATPYRLGSGWLHRGEGAIFSRIIFDIPVQKLIDEGFLCHITTKAGAVKINTVGMHHSCGEFRFDEMESAALKITRAAVADLVSRGVDRKKWLVFAVSVKHAEEIKAILIESGILAEIITGETPAADRDEIIETFKGNRLTEIRALVNVNVLTTGFNVPAVDLIAMMRPTESAGLYVQTVGRGMRNAPGKVDCLILDYAGNVVRHGPIDAVNPVRAQGDGTGPAPAKECPQCGSIVAAGFRSCPDCGFEFPPPELAVDVKPTEAAILKSQEAPPEPRWLEVGETRYNVHQKPGKKDSVRVDYYCGMTVISEWIFPEAGSDSGYFYYSRWCREAGVWDPFPKTAAEFVAFEPNRIQAAKICIVPEGKFTRVTKHEWRKEPVKYLNTEAVVGVGFEEVPF